MLFSITLCNYDYETDVQVENCRVGGYLELKAIESLNPKP